MDPWLKNIYLANGDDMETKLLVTNIKLHMDFTYLDFTLAYILKVNFTVGAVCCQIFWPSYLRIKYKSLYGSKNYVGLYAGCSEL